MQLPANLNHLVGMYGAWIVGGVVGRFVAVLRAFAAVLAGINCMGWRRFLVFNASGGLVWSCAYGIGAFAFGETVPEVISQVGIVLAMVAAVLCFAALILVRKYEARLEDAAERALPGSLRGPGAPSESH